jgi:hypothetical protein
MKSVLIGSDFLKLENEIKFLEINTDIDLFKTTSEFLELGNLITYMKDNSYIKLVLIYKTKHISKFVVDLFESTCSNNDIILEKIVIPPNAISIPSISEEPNAFYLRCAYDVTAIVDDMYCRDKSEMVKLLFESNNQDILPKTYVINSNDDIVYDNFTELSDNGMNPNTIVKKIFPDFTKTEFPAFYKINSTEELSNLKQSLPSDVLVQDYKFNNNNIVNGRISDVIRTWTILLSDLETIIDLGGCVYQNVIPLNSSEITYTYNKLDKKWRNMYFTNPVTFEGVPSDYNVIKIENNEEIVVDVSTLVVGDMVKSAHLVGLEQDESSIVHTQWTSSLSLMELMQYSTGSVITKYDAMYEGWVSKINFEYETTSGSFITTNSEVLLIKEDTGTIRFKKIYDIQNTDSVVISNQIAANVTSIDLEWYSGSITSINIEPDDVFIAGTDLNGVSSNIMGNFFTIHNEGFYK